MLYRIALIYFIYIQIAVSHTLPLHISKSTKETYTTALIIQTHYPYTFFCHTPFSTTGTIHTQDCSNCAMTETKIKWIPIVPPDFFAKDLPCFKEKICINKNGKWHKGQSCCNQRSPLYIMMSRDLFNLVPESPQLAKLRGHRNFSPFNENTAGCPFKLDRKNKKIYINPSQLGFVARTFLYMADTYSLTLPQDMREQYLSWHKTYPPSSWEHNRNLKIKSIQGNENHWVTSLNDDNAMHHNMYLLHS